MNKNQIKILYDYLRLCKIEYLKNETMSRHCSVKVGGVAPYLVFPNTIKKFVNLLHFLKQNEIKYYILGKGTNVLIKDGNLNKIFISTKKLKFKKITKNSIYVECGLGLFELNKILAQNNLSGLEFTYGIPGSVGGAVVMNAGAFEHSISEFVDYVIVLKNGEIKKYSNKQMNFSYRNSIAQSDDIVVLGAKFNLKRDDNKNIVQLQNSYLSKKMASQPYDKPSFGSTFKKYDGVAISKVIDELGLKGYRIGDAQISEKHAGFIVNLGNATCQDYLKMIKYIKRKIKEECNILPSLEVKLVK